MSCRVAVRCRSLTTQEQEEGHGAAVRLDLANSALMVSNNDKSDSENPLVFDKSDAVFNNCFSPRDIFLQEVHPIVDKVMEGFNGAVMAFGVHGSGKKHTMLGDLENQDLHGMIPQTLAHIFSEIKKKTTAQVNFNVKVTLVDIFQGKCRDLLQDDIPTLDIKEEAEENESKKSFFLKGVKELEVTSELEAITALVEGNKRRAAARSEELVRQSSQLFSVLVEQKDLTSDPSALAPTVANSSLQLVHLADCGRPHRDADSEVLKGASSVALSLSALSNVLDFVNNNGQKQDVPYHSSPLTMLLKNHLNEKSLMLLLATVSPSDRCVNDTVATLRFVEHLSRRGKNKKTWIPR